MIVDTFVDFAGFAPPQPPLRHGDELPLGERVKWTHRAAVARWHTRDTSETFPPHWRLTEGFGKDEREPWIGPQSEDFNPRDPFNVTWPDCPFYRDRGGPDLTKTVIVWPAPGEGVLFGFVRRGIGQGWAESGGYNQRTMEHDYEPGGFTASRFVPLYAVKCQLRGVSYLLAPCWSVTAKRECLVADKVYREADAS